MSHASELLARRREEDLDPGADLFLREHLAVCADCLDLERSIARADRLIAERAPALHPRPRLVRATRTRIPTMTVLVGALGIALAATGWLAGTALRELRSVDDVASSGPPLQAAVPDLPPHWSLQVRGGLLFAVPPDWDALSDARDRELADPRPQLGLAMLGGGTTIKEVIENVRASGVLVSDRAIAADRPMHAYSTRSSSPSSDSNVLTQHVLVQIDERTIVVLTVPSNAAPNEDAATLELVARSLFVLRDTRDIATAFTEAAVTAALAGVAPLETAQGVDRTYGIYQVDRDKYSFAHIRVFPDRATRQQNDPNLTTIKSIADWVSPVTYRGIGNVLVMVGSRDVNLRYRMLRALDRLIDPGAVIAPYTRAEAARPDVTAQPLPTAEPPPMAAPGRTRIDLYRPADVLRGLTRPYRSSTVDATAYFPVLDRGAERAVLDPHFETSLRIFDLRTGQESSMGVPELHLYSRVFWLPDGRLLVTGPAVLVGSPGGAATVVADLFSQSSAVSPDGREVALWRYGDEHIRIVDLASGATRASPDRYFRCGEDGTVPITWSPDGAQLAVSSCASDLGEDLMTWFIDARTGQRLRSIPDVFVHAWPSAGALFGSTGTRPREPEFARLSPEGRVLSRHPFGSPSPDGRYLVARVIKDAPTAAEPQRRVGVAVLVEVSTGRSVELGGDIWTADFTPEGDLYLVTQEVIGR